jgi:hypothetical protein
MSNIYKSIIPREYSLRIYKASYLCLISSVYSLYNKKYSVFFVASSVFLTSINYWKNPISGIRKKIDVTTVIVGLSYNIYQISKTNIYYILFFYLNILMGGICYYIATTYGKKMEFNKSTKWHVGIHVTANISNLILVRGLTSL